MRKRSDNETHCHCGHLYRGSDHCPDCGCEQYESRDCGLTWRPLTWIKALRDLHAVGIRTF